MIDTSMNKMKRECFGFVSHSLQVCERASNRVWNSLIYPDKFMSMGTLHTENLKKLETS